MRDATTKTTTRTSMDVEEEAAFAELPDEQASPQHAVSNEYVLNIAFLSFFGFTAVQFFFALLAHSESMMTDCAAMTVDVVTYLFNFIAERLKHGGGESLLSARDLRLRRLYLELIPPLISVVTLIAVTVMALKQAFATLVSVDDEDVPDLAIMLLFSGLNLLLDILNVSCFARVDQAVGLPGQQSHQPHGHAHHNSSERTIPHATEDTRLLLRSDTDDLTSEESTDATGVLNLNMCSAWTHVCADTLRSIAVLVASAVSYVFPNLLTPVEADSDAAILVSIIILISIVPLIQGLYQTAFKIYGIWTGRECLHDSVKGLEV